MSGAEAAGRVLVVGASADEAGVIVGALPGARPVRAADLENVIAADGDVSVVVIGSKAPAPVALAQRAHRAAPDAGVAILTTDDTDALVRREVSYAPGIPLELLVVRPDAELPEHIGRLREAAGHRRRHLALLSTVSTRSAAVAAPQRPEAVRLRALFEQAPLGIVVCDQAGLLLGWNRHAEALLGLRPASLGEPVDTRLRGAGGLVARLSGAVQAESTGTELFAIGDRELEVSAVTSELDDGRPATLLLVLDVTSRRAAERSRDRLAGHVELLADVSDALAATLDATQAVELLAVSLVRALGDWVLVRIPGDPAGTNVVAVQHRDAALAPVTERIRTLVAPGRIVTPLGRRVATGEPCLLSDLTDLDLLDHLGDAELARLVSELGVDTMMAVPLRGRSGVLGALVVGSASPSRHLGETELAVAVEVGRRAGTALDNARLYAQQRELATELQRSLLTDPPSWSKAADIEVRYVAAAEQSQVGGDWYDAFVQPGGTTALVIGDVVGHDTRAAAAMGQLRGLLRGIAYTTDADPAEVLARVDAAIEGLSLGTTATAVVARLSAPDGDGLIRLDWSNAGHPPPVVVQPDGRIEVLAPEDDDDADLLLGIDPGTPRRTASATLTPGSTVLLYTDGLVERRGQSLDEGIEALATVLAASWQLALDDLCDTALRRLLPDEPEDDVALVAVRVRGGAPR